MVAQPRAHHAGGAVGRGHDLLPTWDEEWLVIDRERQRQQRMRALISAHLGEGDVSGAVRQLAAYRKLLGHELGSAPSHQLAGIVTAALRAEAPATR